MNNKKHKIIESAFALFYHNGIHAVGINEIIKVAGVAKKTLYKHFVSKDELIIATLNYRHTLFMDWLAEQLNQAVLGKDALLALFEAFDDWFNGRVASLGEFRGCYFNNSCAEYAYSNQAIYTLCKQHKDEIRAVVQSHVNSFAADTQKNALLVDTTCQLIEGAINSAFQQQKLDTAQKTSIIMENLLRFKR